MVAQKRTEQERIKYKLDLMLKMGTMPIFNCSTVAEFHSFLISEGLNPYLRYFA